MASMHLSIAALLLTTKQSNLCSYHYLKIYLDVLQQLLVLSYNPVVNLSS